MTETGTIQSLTGKWAPLNNFWIERNGKSAEHIFQAAKTDDPAERAHVLSREKPGQANYAGKRVTLRKDWEERKEGFMEEILRRKFRDPDLRKLLDETGDAQIIEGNRWHDNYWGQCLCTRPKCASRTGRNTLGNLLMKIREENRRNA